MLRGAPNLYIHITSFISITLLHGTDDIPLKTFLGSISNINSRSERGKHQRISNGILSVPHNIVMDVNNVMQYRLYITIFVNLGIFSAFRDSYKYKNMYKITHILENVVKYKNFEAGVHIKNIIKNSYQDGLGRTTQTLDHVVVVYLLI